MVGTRTTDFSGLFSYTVIGSTGIVLCVDASSRYNLTVGGPVLPKKGQDESQNHNQVSYASGTAEVVVELGKWHTLELTTIAGTASGSLDGKPLFTGSAIRSLDTGFGALGMNDWYGVQFDDFSVKQAGSRWTPEKSPCGPAKIGDIVGARNCSTNGLPAPDMEWELQSSWQLKHIPSGLCATAESASPQSKLSLQKCEQIGSQEGEPQQFKNDYTRIRNAMEPMTGLNGLKLAGSVSGSVELREIPSLEGWWGTWVYFPNTNQLRNQYVANEKLGYPMCLSTCGS